MRKPKMILFDYGQTLVNEKRFDGIAGINAVLRYAIKNKYNHTAEDIQAAADAIDYPNRCHQQHCLLWRGCRGTDSQSAARA